MPSKEIELTILMPCLEETETLAHCIKQADAAVQKDKLNAEVLVANNGGKDECYQIASELADGVVLVEERGYGNALRAGIEAAQGKYIFFADADGSYDFGRAKDFYDLAKQGNDLVIGCRLAAGGGTIEPGAMPFLHRWLGSPFFSSLIRLLFGAPINDVHCGMRTIKKSFFEELELSSPGMEFASEMIIKASQFPDKIAELPITLYQDKRVNTSPHLRTFVDGWRHLMTYIKFKLRGF
ncbi:MAG: glycosyltransferase family 2 protein [Candidatus Melainabacteria bacterium]|nr:glycosyltransferase family 2 protein [Candidatus Melainabacteria bacterium]